MMDFLSNLASLALGKMPGVKPLFTSISLDDTKSGIDETVMEISLSTKDLSGNFRNENSSEIDGRIINSETNNQKIENKINLFSGLDEDNSKVKIKSGILLEEKDEIGISSNSEMMNTSRQIDNNADRTQNNILQQQRKFSVNESFNEESVGINFTYETGGRKKIKNIEEESVLDLESKNTKEDIGFKKMIEKNPLNTKNKGNTNYNPVIKPENTNTVRINIGRIEVKAIYPEQKKVLPPEQKKPQLSLDDYLRSFNKDKR